MFSLDRKKLQKYNFIMIISILCQLLKLKRRKKLVILTYHRVLKCADPILKDDVDKDVFEKQMRILARYFNVLSLDDALEYLKQDSLPAGAVCITFDDGYRDNYEIAAPILKRHSLPATIFVASGFIGNGVMWNDLVIEAIRKTKKQILRLDDIELNKLKVGSIAEKIMAINIVLNSLKYLPKLQRTEYVESLIRACDVDSPNGLMMTEKQLGLLSDYGVSIGAHTVTHPILKSLSDKESKYEIDKSRADLEKITGKKITHFAYPNGKYGKDYDLNHVDILRKSGFELAVTTHWGAALGSDDNLQLPRIAPWERTENKFALRIVKELLI